MGFEGIVDYYAVQGIMCSNASINMVFNNCIPVLSLGVIQTKRVDYIIEFSV